MDWLVHKLVWLHETRIEIGKSSVYTAAGPTGAGSCVLFLHTVGVNHP